MSRSSFLILHGIGNHRPPEHWQFLLAARLRERGNEVLYPQLPAPDTPSVDVWRRVLLEQIDLMATGGERVLICHSLSCLLWFQTAREFNAGQQIDRLLLVSPPASELVPEPGAGFRIEQLDAERIKASVRSTIRLVCSDNDPYNPDSGAVSYATALDADIDILPGAGHITPATGYGSWPSAETWCLNKGARLLADGAG